MTGLSLHTAAVAPGLLRLPVDVLAGLGLSPGNVLAPRGARLTQARVRPSPRGGGRAELLANLGLSSGQRVAIHPAALRSVILRAKTRIDLRESLYDQPLTLGDQRAAADILALDPEAGLFAKATTLSLETALLSEGIIMAEQFATPLLRRDLFQRLGIAPQRGLLFIGPPGSGKTRLARAVAPRTSAAFFQISGPGVVSKDLGDREAALRAIFQAAAKAAPAIVFIHEIDAIAPRRDALSGEKRVEGRFVAQLLTRMDGLSDRGRIIVMAATNLPDSLSPALRHPGRLDREASFVPSKPLQRKKILQVHLASASITTSAALRRSLGEATPPHITQADVAQAPEAFQARAGVLTEDHLERVPHGRT